jgi:hypothetical protein
MATHDREEALRRLKLSKIHLTPRLLERCPRRIAVQFDSVWAPVEGLAQLLHPLPTALLQFVAQLPRGHLVLTAGASSYEAIVQLPRGQELEAVASVSLTDVVEEPLRALHMVGHLLDHLLGCQGDSQGGWLSDGLGFSPSWLEIGRQVLSRFELGHAIDPVAAASPRQYFARSVAWYVRDRHRLNVGDPLIERLLRHTLFSESFCQRTLLSGQE